MREATASRARVRPVLWLGLLVVVLGAVLVWRLPRLPSRQPAAAVVPAPAFEAPWSTEQQWLVDQIVRDLSETAVYAASRSAPGPDAVTLKVAQPESSDPLRQAVSVELSVTATPGAAASQVAETLRFEEHLFSPRQYQGIARLLLPAGGGPAPGAPAAPGAALLEALLDLRAAVLVAQDRRLSDRLRENPLDPSAHEEAALLLGAHALREAAGCFTDTRLTLCRMTSHLAMARALRQDGEPSLAGRYAEVVLLTLIGRQADALARLQPLEAAAAQSRPQAAWVRALKLRNTGDYRLTRGLERVTLLEGLAEFRAMFEGLDDMIAVEQLQRRGAAPVPDWGRIALEHDFGVGTGRLFVPATLAQEMAEIAEVWQLLGGQAVAGDPMPLVKALDEPPARLVSRDAQGQARVAVLGWPAWASSAQRHLLQQLLMGERFIGQSLALKEDGKAFAQQGRQLFGGLALYPVVPLAAADREAVQVAASAADAKRVMAGLARRHPEWMTAGHWIELRATPKGQKPVGLALPDEQTWFRPILPSGTALDLDYRLRHRPRLVASPPTALRARRELAPYNFNLARWEVMSGGVNLHSIPRVKEAYGALVDYHVPAMSWLTGPAEYDSVEGPRVLGQLCDLVPEKCFRLGDWFVEHRRRQEAAAAYQKAFDLGRDRVAVSHRMDWLIDYYFEQGQQAKAMTVARGAAETYSGGGLAAMALLQERLGHLSEAEQWNQRLKQRYDDRMNLLGFYYRQARVAHRAAYESKLQALLPEAMPKGIVPLDRAGLPSPPADGVLVKNETNWTTAYGLKAGNVIVSLDGIRVRTLEEYFDVRGFSSSPHMVLLVWKGQAYDEVQVDLPDRRFECEMLTYKPPPPPSPRS